MAKIGDLFPSKWLKANDIESEDDDGNPINPTFTIEQVHQVEFGPNKDLKLTLEFQEVDKHLVLNKTNIDTLVGMFQDDTDDWVGKRVTLFVTPTTFEGKTYQAIRIRAKTSKPKKPIVSRLPGVSKAFKEPREDLTVAPIQEDEHEKDEAPF